jgi:hypothetical protein
METDLNEGLRGMNVEGSIKFSIKARDTEENERVHNAFKEFAKQEWDDNYTLALKDLLQTKEADYKYEAMWEHINHLGRELHQMKETKEEPKEKDEEQNEVF